MGGVLLLFAGAVYLVLTVLSLTVFAWDKRAAAAGRRRVPERTLHVISLLGGWPGTLLGMRALRHKRRKRGFVALTWAAAAAHLAAWLVAWWLAAS